MEINTGLQSITKELKDQWVAALRSGKYEQGRGLLLKDDKFCCIGVLCDIINPTDWVYSSTIGPGIYSYTRGIHYAPVEILSLNIQTPLSIMNDEEGKSFNEIADWIEDNVIVD